MLKKTEPFEKLCYLVGYVAVAFMLPGVSFPLCFFVDVVRGEVLILNSRILYISLRLSWGGDVFL